MNTIIVTESAKNLRALGRAAMATYRNLSMTGALVYGVAVLLPPTLIAILFQGTLGQNVSGLYTLLVNGPFTLGVAIFFLTIFRRQNPELAQVFYGFEYFLKSLGLFLYMALWVLLWTLLFIIPGIIALFRYSQAFYVLADHPEYGIRQCVQQSKRLMMGNKAKYFYMSLSFIGWGVLCSLPLGYVEKLLFDQPNSVIIQLLVLVAYLPYAWLLPYVSLTQVAFYEIISGNLRADSGFSSISAPVSTEEK
jgi:uncharacterized membrane protein